MLAENDSTNFLSRIEISQGARDRVRELVSTGRWKEADTDKNRLARFLLKQEIKNPQGPESQIGRSIDWLDVSFFAEANKVQSAVANVKIFGGGMEKTASGFMISNRLFITNNHVIETKEEAENARIIFNRQNDELGKPLPTTVYKLDPEVFFLPSDENELDYTIVALGNRISGNLMPEEIGYFILSDAPDKHILGMNVNIIQHPYDLPKVINARNNLLTWRDDNVLLYETDTATSSSGSPVCNDDWDLVALHHYAGTHLATPDADIPKYANEGVRISTIYKHLSKKVEGLIDDKRALLVEALSFAKTQPIISKKLPTKSPIPVKETGLQLAHNLDNTIQQNHNLMQTNNNEAKITIPLEITVRIGNLGNINIDQPSQKVQKDENNFASEASKIDRNYSNRSGYVDDFIPGYVIKLPRVKNSDEIAPLKENQIDREKGVLKYEHFAIIISQTRKCAFFSATNIDGKTYKSVNRKTGKVTPREYLNQEEGEEGEVWWDDDRIDSSYHLNQALFSGWSHLFDRGHLTRRGDVSWGTDEIALRADADTFHLSNVSLQHWRFNQTMEYWQGIERFVLENGLLASKSNMRFVVFQGPIYDDEIDWFADERQIPSKFFKIVVWDSEAAGKLQAVGMIANQEHLYNEQRKGLKQGGAKKPDVSQWRIAIREIEGKTGLDFGDIVRNADTISNPGVIRVGEAGKTDSINSWSNFSDLFQKFENSES